MKILKISLIVLAVLVLIYVAYIIIFKKKEEVKPSVINKNTLASDYIRDNKVILAKPEGFNLVANLLDETINTGSGVRPGDGRGGVGELISLV